MAAVLPAANAQLDSATMAPSSTLTPKSSMVSPNEISPAATLSNAPAAQVSPVVPPRATPAALQTSARVPFGGKGGKTAAAAAKSLPKSTGRWTTEEHDEFLKYLDIYGREWKKVAERITTRTAAQIRSHAQKYFKKLESTGEDAARPAPTQTSRSASPNVLHPRFAPTCSTGAETLAGALGALDDMLRALRSKRAEFEEVPVDDYGVDEAAPARNDDELAKRPRAWSEGSGRGVKRARAGSDACNMGMPKRRVTCEDLRALEALELLREATRPF